MANPEKEDIKLQKAIFIYEDGSIAFLDGDDARRWLAAINSALILDFDHNAAQQDQLKNVHWHSVEPGNDPAAVLKRFLELKSL